LCLQTSDAVPTGSVLLTLDAATLDPAFCSLQGNNGKLTVDAVGNLKCAADIGTSPGTVTGPNPTVVGQLAWWNNTTGTLLGADAGLSYDPATDVLTATKVLIGTTINNGVLSLKTAAVNTPVDLLTLYEGASAGVHYGIGLTGNYTTGAGELLYHTSANTGKQRFGYGTAAAFTQVMAIESDGQVVLNPSTSPTFNARLNFGDNSAGGTEYQLIAFHDPGSASQHPGIGFQLP